MDRDFFLSDFEREGKDQVKKSVTNGECRRCFGPFTSEEEPIPMKSSQNIFLCYSPFREVPPIKKVIQCLRDCYEKAQEGLEDQKLQNLSSTYLSEEDPSEDDEDDNVLESLSEAFLLLIETLEAVDQDLTLIRWDCEDCANLSPVAEILSMLRGLQSL